MENIALSNDNIYPVNNLVLIDPMVKPQQTTSGLNLPNQQDHEAVPMLGTILRAGEKVTGYKIGDVVLFRRYSSDKIIQNDGTGEKLFWLLEQESILAIIK